MTVRLGTDQSPQAAPPDLGGLILRVNAQGVVLDFGAAEANGAILERGELLARRIDQVLPGEIAAVVMQALVVALESGTAQRIAYASPDTGEEPRHFEARFAPTRGGQCLVVIAAIPGSRTAAASRRSPKKTTRPRAPRAADLRTASRSLEREAGKRQGIQRTLRESEERYRRLVEAGPDAILIHQAGRIRFASARAAKLAGVADPRELVGRPIAEFLRPADRLTELAPARRRPEDGDLVEVRETLFQRVNGAPIPVEVTAVAIAEGGRPAVQAVIRDIRKRTRAHQALRESEERYRRLIQTAPIALLTHRQGRIRFANAKALDLLGVGLSSALKNRSLLSFVCTGDRPVVRLRMRRARERRGPVQPCELRLQRLDGTLVDVEFSAIAVTEHGAPAVQVALLDVTARKNAEARIRHWAHHDALTGLPNRTLLLDRLQHALAQARRDRKKLAVMMLDLDHFKDVNDTLGHPVGDQLLCAVAERLRSIIRESDTLARFGGDELVLIQTGLDSAAGARVLAQKIVEALAEPFAIEGEDVRTSCSLGIALFPEGGTVAETLLKNADLALYRAKARGRALFEFYAEAMRAEVHTRRALEDDLRRALERREFRLLYQPQYDLGTERLVGAEALLRWYHPKRGVMRPQAFLGLVEGTSLIGPIARWVLEEVCRQAGIWSRDGTAVRVGVKLYAAQCREPDFIDTLVALLARQNLMPHLLDLEITESLFVDAYGGHGIGNLRRLGDLGIKISIDDFGTGYSSLGYLKRLRVDHIKLDSSFVEGIGRSTTDEAIVRTVVALGRSLDKRVIADGVGTEQQRLFLRDLGCDYAQGRLLGEAMPAEEIRPLLKAGVRAPAREEQAEARSEPHRATSERSE